MVRLRKVHPGATLAAELRARKIDIQSFANLTGVKFKILWFFIHGKRLLSKAQLSKISNALGTDSVFWFTLQDKYRGRM